MKTQQKETARARRMPGRERLLRLGVVVLLAAALAAVMSAFFGVLSACCDTLYVAVGFPDLDLGAYWVAYYIRGLWFDLVHIVSNVVVVSALFIPLCKAGDRIKRGGARS